MFILGCDIAQEVSKQSLYRVVVSVTPSTHSYLSYTSTHVGVGWGYKIFIDMCLYQVLCDTLQGMNYRYSRKHIHTLL